ncbi:hypothetical protein Pelo_7572 [Pelomyxa schiedti]|nr:hypothetical protein Pelo_7572 [Pelomyxa schiedti]
MRISYRVTVVVWLCILWGCAWAQWCTEPAIVQHYWTGIYGHFETTQYGSLNDNDNDTYTGLCGSSQLPDAWYTFQPTVSGQLVASTCGTTWDTVIEVQGGTTCSGRVCEATDDDGCAYASIVTLSASAYTFYNIRIRPWAYYSTTAHFMFTLEFTPAGVQSTSESSSSSHNTQHSNESDDEFCPDRVFIWDEGSSTYYLTSGNDVNTGDCWDDELIFEYGMWFEFFTDDSSKLSICSDWPITLIFVRNLCESSSTPYCYYTASSNWKGWDDCEYQIEVDVGSNYDWNLRFLVKSQHTDTITVSTYTYEWSSSHEWYHFPFWLVVLAFSLLFLSLGLFCLLGAYCCHKRIANRRREQFQHLDVQNDLVEIPYINRQPASTETTQPYNLSPSVIAPPSVEPPFTPLYGYVSFFQQQQQQLIVPPTQPPPQLYPTITLPSLTPTTSNN